MDEVDKDAIECVEIQTAGARNIEVLKNKNSLLQIRLMRDQPILKCGNNYVVIDGADTAYIYEGK